MWLKRRKLHRNIRRGRSVSVRPIAGRQPVLLLDNKTEEHPGQTDERQQNKEECPVQEEGSNIIDLLDDDEQPPPTPFPLLPTPTEPTGVAVVDHDDHGTEQSMELSTPLQSTVILGDVTLGNHADPQLPQGPHEPPRDTAIERSSVPGGSDSAPGIPESPSTEADEAERSRREYMERRIQQLEGELRAAREELSATDENLRQLREFIEIVQMDMDNGDQLLTEDVAG